MKSLFVLTISLILSIGLVAKESPEYLLENLPESMLFFEAGKITLYDKPELGASRKYSKELRSSTAWASVYIFDQGFKNISQEIIEKSYEMAYQNIITFYNKAIRIDENKGSLNLKLNESKNIKINYAWFKIVKGDSSKISTYLFVTGDDHYIYKIRISSKKLNKNEFPIETLPSKKISAGPDIIYFVEGILESIDSKLNGTLDEDKNNTKYKQSSLHQAVTSQKADAVKDLLNKHAEIDSVDILGRTPLHYAAIGGYVEIAELLLDRGANINAMDSSKQWTPLFYATFMQHKEMVKLLIKKGADQALKDKIYRVADSYKTDWNYKESESDDLIYIGKSNKNMNITVEERYKMDRWQRDGNLVTDTKLGLMWEDTNVTKSNKKTLENAKRYCEKLFLGGYRDWRLPSMEELLTLKKIFIPRNFKNGNHTIMPPFANVALGYYWSSSEIFVDYHGFGGPPSKYYPFSVDFLNKNSDYQKSCDDNKLFVRCVRGGELKK